jgi:hypothetical protein
VVRRGNWPVGYGGWGGPLGVEYENNMIIFARLVAKPGYSEIGFCNISLNI